MKGKIQREETLRVERSSCAYAKRVLHQYGTVLDKYLIKKDRRDN